MFGQAVLDSVSLGQRMRTVPSSCLRTARRSRGWRVTIPGTREGSLPSAARVQRGRLSKPPMPMECSKAQHAYNRLAALKPRHAAPEAGEGTRPALARLNARSENVRSGVRLQTWLRRLYTKHEACVENAVC